MSVPQWFGCPHANEKCSSRGLSNVFIQSNSRTTVLATLYTALEGVPQIPRNLPFNLFRMEKLNRLEISQQ